jgi:hypothetical protein
MAGKGDKSWIAIAREGSQQMCTGVGLSLSVLPQQAFAAQRTWPLDEEKAKRPNLGTKYGYL